MLSFNHHLAYATHSQRYRTFGCGKPALSSLPNMNFWMQPFVGELVGDEFEPNSSVCKYIRGFGKWKILILNRTKENYSFLLSSINSGALLKSTRSTLTTIRDCKLVTFTIELLLSFIHTYIHPFIHPFFLPCMRVAF